MKSRVFLFLTTLGLIVPVLAGEGGASRYVPGNSATLIDLPPTKAGWVVESMYLHYEGDASASGTFPNAGLVTAGLDATSDAWITGAFHTFETPVLDSHYSVGAFLPYLWMDVEANVVAGGTTGARSDSADGIGDPTLLPVMMAWKCDSWQYSSTAAHLRSDGRLQCRQPRQRGTQLLDLRSDPPGFLQQREIRLQRRHLYRRHAQHGKQRHRLSERRGLPPRRQRPTTPARGARIPECRLQRVLLRPDRRRQRIGRETR